MTSTVASLATRGASASAPTGWSHTIGSNLTLKASTSSSQRIARYLFIHMYRLCMLTEVIKPRESARTMTLEGALSGMFPANLGQIFQSQVE